MSEGSLTPVLYELKNFSGKQVDKLHLVMTLGEIKKGAATQNAEEDLHAPDDLGHACSAFLNSKIAGIKSMSQPKTSISSIFKLIGRRDVILR